MRFILCITSYTCNCYVKYHWRKLYFILSNIVFVKHCAAYYWQIIWASQTIKKGEKAFSFHLKIFLPKLNGDEKGVLLIISHKTKIAQAMWANDQLFVLARCFSHRQALISNTAGDTIVTKFFSLVTNFSCFH